MNIEQTAAICHEVNRTYCQSIGDNSQPAWEDAPDWQRQSAINGVRFHVEELEKGGEPKPEASHENWLKEKLADGWVYGEKKDPDVRTHPCCVSYDQLPETQKVKDYLFVAVVKTAWTNA